MELTVFSKLPSLTDNVKNEKEIRFEIVKLKTGVVFTSWIRSVGGTLGILRVLFNKERATNDDYYKNYMILCTGPGRNSKGDVEFYYKSHKALKNKKNKTKADLIQFGKGENIFKNIKKELLDYCVKYGEYLKVNEFLPFIEERHFDIYSIIEDLRPEYFIGHLTECEINYCLDGTLFEMTDNILNSDTNTFQQRDGWSFFNIPLFQLPDLNSLNYAQLNIIRKEFLERFDPFYKPFSDLQIELSKIIYDATNHEIIQNKIAEVFNPCLPLFKEATENNVYFNMIKNSITDVPVYQLSAVVTSINTLIELFVKDNIITPHEKEIIIEGVKRTKDINSTVAFFYLDKIKS